MSWVAWIVIGLVGVVASVICVYVEQKRTQKLKQMAAIAGYEFYGVALPFGGGDTWGTTITKRVQNLAENVYKERTGKPAYFRQVLEKVQLPEALLQTRLFSRGYRGYVMNIMHKCQGDMRVLALDYQYKWGRRCFRRQTVVMIESQRCQLPEFEVRQRKFRLEIGGQEHDRRLRPAGWVERIEFGGYPQLAERYAVSGIEEGAVRNCFGPAFLSFLANGPAPSMEGNGQVLVCYFQDRTLSVSERRQLIKMAVTAYELLSTGAQ